jgi:hypothetical protein
MKKLLLLLVLLAAPSFAQEAYTVNATASQVQVLDYARTTYNARICAAAQLPATCTQAQYNAANPTSPATIYANSQAGRQAFLIAQWIAEDFRTAKTRLVADNKAAQCTYWNDPARTLTEKNAMCTSAGLSAGCDLCE